MLNDGPTLSALDWWTEAGVDTLVDDAPRDWLARAMPTIAEPLPAAARPAPAAAMPDDLAGLRHFLLTDAEVPGPAAARLDAMGDPATGSMVLVDMPEAADRAAGRLLAGEAGALFDRMLTAMKLDRSAIYLAPFAPARPAAGRLSAQDCDALAPLIRRHVTLARPKRLLLLGDAPVRALFGLSLAQARGEVRPLELEGFGVLAVASFHPRLVLERPDYRKPAWADLQLFMGL